MLGQLIKGAWQIGKEAARKGAEKAAKVDPNDVLAQSTVDDVLHLIKEILF